MAMAIARIFLASNFNFDHVHPEIAVFLPTIAHNLGNEETPKNVKVGGAWLYTAIMWTTYPRI